ncbi:hypothetical protein JDY09_06880 [Thermoleophilum album]|jgi:hypothetical protein|nr:hypothetical protein [Thermoleophilum album]MCL6439923.1 hypothetical protein [Thermoleophilum sp.]WDT93109.1 hypothetical protein JDY09_06880 [Thermoleophilum album]
MKNASLARAAWWTTVALCAVTAALLAVNGYYGYAGVLVAVGLAAAVNLM